ncbi:amino acid ABC transporter substrate-binding protein [Ralstonia mojiangensis]|uniref:Amino acid ABC transporter substrate-binding protein n=1 Tax=Ralstonia mojiangensis TaxID=2953895 RepID=A0ABT2L980_9RALS|nr:amino acid ABC transporter substrate-binding protein [Ralstonia mojiangensis]MCO5414108.1 amino acid ABC transporter substrate-binding protein [Ralstonia mojiangensis]MCT7297642.1 amino acid ABC transporter substrate-binding protein [Ralstonia mojiangensis]MCT7311982.1 amino acid ABC transporter substrate-binding protein [Ralstonia mojiangensis]MCT7327566.1 amino acid ABC transporter substrate-binding protein [Ralstonia mojiangensis]
MPLLFSRARPIAAPIVVLLSIFAPGLALASSTPVLDRIRDTGTIRLAYRESSVPFSFYDTDKKPVGYAMDLCLRVVDKLRIDLKRPDLKVQYVMVTPSSRIPTIAEGKADLECGSTTNTRERREKVAFTIPHYIAGSRMIVKTSSGILKWDDLRGKTAVSTKGTTNITELRKVNDARVLGMKILEAKDHAEAFAMVESGKADAFAMDDVLLYGFRANARSPGEYAVVGDMLTVEPYAIMLSKDDAEFKHLVDRAMTNIILDYDAEKLYRKWFLQPIPPNGVRLDIPMNFLLRDSFKYPSDKTAD